MCYFTGYWSTLETTFSVFFLVILGVTIVATLLAFNVGIFKPYDIVLATVTTGSVPSIRPESNSIPIEDRPRSCTFELFKDYVVTGIFFLDEETWVRENKTLSYFEPLQSVLRY